MSLRNYIVAAVLVTGSIEAQRPHRTPNEKNIRHALCTQLKPGNVTLFVHGTTFPAVSRLLLHNPKRRGIYRYTFGPSTGQERLAQVLHDADPEEFPGESFYKFYWSGKLGFDDRKQAASELFSYLKNHQGKITLIAHSHGCNVALYLAELAKQDPSIAIERLILLAPPVQKATEELVHAPIFNKVYSFYSSGDVMQVADPQGIYPETKKDSTESSLFSQRRYSAAPNLVQARIFYDRQSLGHRAFIMPRFFKRIPQLLNVVDKAHSTGKDHVMVTIPRYPLTPQLINKAELAQGYVPRRIRSCTCNRERRFFA